MTFAYSFDEESYHGNFDTIEDACQEAAAEAEAHDSEFFWVGECVPPPQPETMFTGYEVSGFLELVSEQDEYAGEWAEEWDDSTKAQREELAAQIRPIIAAWLDRHGLRPKFYNVIHAKEYRVAGRSGDGYLIETVERKPCKPASATEGWMEP